MNKILITGKNSFIGNSFIKSYGNSFSIKEVDTIKNNVEEIDFLNTDVVIHLAAIVHQTKEISEEIYFKVNRDLAYDIAKKAKEQGVKQFVFLSTAKVFGESTTGKAPWNELSECNPQDAYGKSKLEAEYLLSALEDSNFKVAIVRSPLVYGEGVKANMFNLIKLIDVFPILPLGNIQNKRSFVFVGNLIALLHHIIQNKCSGVFLAGDRQSLSTSILARNITLELNKKRIFISVPRFIIHIIRFIKPSVVDRIYGSLEIDNSITNNKLQFVPPFETQEGIKVMVQWYKKIIK